MMQLALSEIAKSDLLIAEVSEKAIGVGIEVGFAAALGKPVIYLRKTDVEYSTTVGGLATETVVYDNLQDLDQKLAQALVRVNSVIPEIQFQRGIPCDRISSS
jgi:nucleoside 2-deoxyribosyltransferase